MDDTFSAKLNKLQRHINGNAAAISAVTLIMLSLIELLAFKFGGAFSYAASRIWLFCFFVIALTIFAESIVMLYADIRRLSLSVPLFFALILLFLISVIGNLKYSNVSYEAALQVSDGLNFFKSKDFNYTGTGFLGYPSKQYLLNALPSVLFGRSIPALQAGFAFPFILGLCACFTEARHLLRKHGFGESAALLPILLITSSPYIVEFYLIYEQSINPVSFTMLAIAFYLRFRRDPSVFSALALAWTGNLLYNSYSPGASSFMLLFALLGLDMVSEILPAVKRRKRFRKSSSIPCEAGDKNSSPSDKSCAITGSLSGKITPGRASLIPLLKYLPLLFSLLSSFLAVSMAGRKDNLYTLRENISIGQVTKSILNFYTDGSTVFLSVLSGFVLIYSLLSFTGLLGLRNFVIACWSIATVLLSEYLVGYKTDIDMHLLMQRSMVIIPVLCFAIFAELIRFFSKKGPRKFLLSLHGRKAAESAYATAETARKSAGSEHEAAESAYVTAETARKSAESGNNSLTHGLFTPGKLIIPLISLILYLVMVSRSGQPHHAFVYMNHCQALKYTVDTIERTLEDAGIDCEENFTIHYYTDSYYSSNLYDYTDYFFPNAQVVVNPEETPDDVAEPDSTENQDSAVSDPENSENPAGPGNNSEETSEAQCENSGEASENQDRDSEAPENPYSRTFTFYYGIEPPKSFRTSYRYYNPRIGQEFIIYYI